MKPLTSYTCKLTDEQAATLKSCLEARNFTPREVPYARFAGEKDKTNVVFYDSGKLVVQGKGTQEFVEFGLEIKARGGSDKIMTLAYANGRPGYIPHRSAYPAGGYEVDDAYRYYGYPACFAPEAGELVVETALELLEATRMVEAR